MKLAGPQRTDDGPALEDLFARLPVSADWTMGFMTAILTGPDPVTTTDWISVLVPHRTADDAPRADVDLLLRVFDAVGETLRTTPEIICPEPDKPAEDAADFCEGYLRGARLHRTWVDDEGATTKLVPFQALANEDVDAVDANGEPVRDANAWRSLQRERLGSYVAELHAYWTSKRQVVNVTPKVGRNDPCPCGSGKKHKKCCLAKQS